MRSLKSPVKVIAMAAALVLSSISAASPKLSGQTAQPNPPGNNCEYFTDTGHWVCDEFLDFFEDRGGLEIFGNPLTKSFVDPLLGLKVQYFQRARMEFHPYNRDPYQVLLGLLIDELGYNFPPATDIPSDSAMSRYFPETGHVVSYAFLDYFREKGGIDIFGYPRSEFMYEDGYIVQYFQRVRMEWHPEVISGSQMQLTNLGEVYIERFNIPEEHIRPEPDVVRPYPTPPTTSITKLNVSASVRNVITGREGIQTVFVYVTDQLQQPVEGATVKMVVHYQSGDQIYEFEPTNKSGFTNRSFDILPASPGRKVVVDVTIEYGGLNGSTQTFFLPWW